MFFSMGMICNTREVKGRCGSCIFGELHFDASFNILKRPRTIYKLQSSCVMWENQGSFFVWLFSDRLKISRFLYQIPSPGRRSLLSRIFKIQWYVVTIDSDTGMEFGFSSPKLDQVHSAAAESGYIKESKFWWLYLLASEISIVFFFFWVKKNAMIGLTPFTNTSCFHCWRKVC